MCRKHSGRGGGAGVHGATGTPQQSAKGEAWQRALIKHNALPQGPLRHLPQVHLHGHAALSR